MTRTSRARVATGAEQELLQARARAGEWRAAQLRAACLRPPRPALPGERCGARAANCANCLAGSCRKS